MARRKFEVAQSLRLATVIEAEMLQLVRGVSEAQFHAPAPTGGWSIGYCLEHLVLSGGAMNRDWDRAMIAGASNVCPPSGANSFPYALWERMALHWLRNPSPFRRSASQALLPQGRYSIPESLNRFLAMHRGLSRRLESARDLDLRSITMQLPFLPLVKVSLGLAFDATLAHERRHLEQAWRVRRQLAQGHSGEHTV